MPGPQGDCCGGGPTHNNGCGISIGSARSLSGPWTVTPLKIQNQWESDDVYCTHTNPSVQLLPVRILLRVTLPLTPLLPMDLAPDDLAPDGPCS